MNRQDFGNEMEKRWQHDTGDISIGMRNYILHRLAYVASNWVKDVWKDAGFTGEPDLEYASGAVFVTDPQLEPLDAADAEDLFSLIRHAAAQSNIGNVKMRLVRPEIAPERIKIEFTLPDEFEKIRSAYNDFLVK